MPILRDIFHPLPDTSPQELDRMREEGKHAQAEGIERWDNPYSASCDAWRNAWWQGWDEGAQP